MHLLFPTNLPIVMAFFWVLSIVRQHYAQGIRRPQQCPWTHMQVLCAFIHHVLDFHFFSLRRLNIMFLSINVGAIRVLGWEDELELIEKVQLGSYILQKLANFSCQVRVLETIKSWLSRVSCKLSPGYLPLRSPPGVHQSNMLKITTILKLS